MAQQTMTSDQLKAKVLPLIEQWSRGEITLKDIKGYTDEELYAIASQGYFFFLQGKIEPARIIFEGLVAIDPKNAYYYRGLGVIYFQLKNLEKALRQFSYKPDPWRDRPGKPRFPCPAQALRCSVPHLLQKTASPER